MEHIDEKIYGLYQLQWMITHGITLKDYQDKLQENLNLMADDGIHKEDIPSLISAINNAVEYETGFQNGQMYAGFQEFLHEEYQNKEYVHSLIQMLPKAEQKQYLYSYDQDMELNR